MIMKIVVKFESEKGNERSRNAARGTWEIKEIKDRTRDVEKNKTKAKRHIVRAQTICLFSIVFLLQ